MADPQTHSITKLSSFSKTIEDALDALRVRYPDKNFIQNWYRGIGEASSHTLTPGLYRHKKITAIDKLLEMEFELISRFKAESVLLTTMLPFINKENPGFELLFYMQHYGIPTRLLDWTTNPFIALYFALTSAKMDEATGNYLEDAAVWILSPEAWNETALSHMNWGDQGEMAYDNPDAKGYYPKTGSVASTKMPTLPIAMRGVTNSPRMHAQRGVFTLFGQETESMETCFTKHAFAPESLIKIVVAKNDIKPMMQNVLSVGYTDTVTYPDLHGLARELKRHFGFKV